MRPIALGGIIFALLLTELLNPLWKSIYDEVFNNAAIGHEVTELIRYDLLHVIEGLIYVAAFRKYCLSLVNLWEEIQNFTITSNLISL